MLLYIWIIWIFHRSYDFLFSAALFIKININIQTFEEPNILFFNIQTHDPFYTAELEYLLMNRIL